MQGPLLGSKALSLTCRVRGSGAAAPRRRLPAFDLPTPGTASELGERVPFQGPVCLTGLQPLRSG